MVLGVIVSMFMFLVVLVEVFLIGVYLIVYVVSKIILNGKKMNGVFVILGDKFFRKERKLLIKLYGI